MTHVRCSKENLNPKHFFLFIDIPTAPGRPEISDYDEKSVELEFATPESDGGAPIMKYVVQKKDKYVFRRYSAS